VIHDGFNTPGAHQETYDLYDGCPPTAADPSKPVVWCSSNMMEWCLVRINSPGSET
jgi:hypothetical protein